MIKVPKQTSNPRYDLTPEYDPEGVPLTALINPEITPLSDEKRVSWESCLSVPGLMGEVARYKSVRYTWSDTEGEKHVREAHGFHAKLVQHECDHLDGILFPQRVQDMRRFGFNEEVFRYLQAA